MHRRARRTRRIAAGNSEGMMTVSEVPRTAEKGIVGPGIFVDMARYRGEARLDKGETFTHEDLVAAAEAQGQPIGPLDDVLKEPA
jgi:hypothetical protein